MSRQRCAAEARRSSEADVTCAPEPYESLRLQESQQAQLRELAERIGGPDVIAGAGGLRQAEEVAGEVEAVRAAQVELEERQAAHMALVGERLAQLQVRIPALA